MLIPEVAEETVLSGEDQISEFLETEKHLLENIFVGNTVFDETSGCDKIEFSFENIWVAFDVVVLSKSQLLEIQVNFLFLSFVKHVVAAVNTGEIFETSITKGF